MSKKNKKNKAPRVILTEEEQSLMRDFTNMWHQKANIDEEICANEDVVEIRKVLLEKYDAEFMMNSFSNIIKEYFSPEYCEEILNYKQLDMEIWSHFWVNLRFCLFDLNKLSYIEKEVLENFTKWYYSESTPKCRRDLLKYSRDLHRSYSHNHIVGWYQNIVRAYFPIPEDKLNKPTQFWEDFKYCLHLTDVERKVKELPKISKGEIKYAKYTEREYFAKTSYIAGAYEYGITDEMIQTKAEEYELSLDENHILLGVLCLIENLELVSLEKLRDLNNYEWHRPHVVYNDNLAWIEIRDTFLKYLVEKES